MAAPLSIRENTVKQTESEQSYERWKRWPVNWTAVTVGVLASVSIVIVLSLFAVAIGVEKLNPEERLVDLKAMHRSVAIFSVCAAFFSFVTAGWICGKIAGILHSEPAMLHGAIVWCGAVPLLAMLSATGVSGNGASWFSGMSSRQATAPFEVPETLPTTASDYERRQYETSYHEYLQNIKKWNADTPKVVRNSALCAASALLLALVGSVIGGWMASGEPMTFTHQRKTKAGISV